MVADSNPASSISALFIFQPNGRGYTMKLCELMTYVRSSLDTKGNTEEILLKICEEQEENIKQLAEMIRRKSKGGTLDKKELMECAQTAFNNAVMLAGISQVTSYDLTTNAHFTLQKING